MSVNRELVLILDFGSQYTQLIARRVRELKVYCEIHPFNLPLEQIRSDAARARSSSRAGRRPCYEPGAPTVDQELFELGVPMLGICYGVQLMAKLLGGSVRAADKREYGRAHVKVNAAGARTALFHGCRAGEELAVWMCHGDRVEAAAGGLRADRRDAQRARCRRRRREAAHLRRAVPPRGGAHAARRRDPRELPLPRLRPRSRSGRWPRSPTRRSRTIRAQVGERGRVICGLSGGVDSSVAAMLLLNAIGDRLTCIFVDNGLLRQGERAGVEALFAGAFHADLHVVDAEARFLERSRGVTDPEQKRKIIGREFIDVFEEEAKRTARRASTFSRRARSIPTSSRASRTRGRRRPSRATTTSAGCPSG